MLITFFKNFGYYKSGKTYDLKPTHADYLLKESFSCYNDEPIDNILEKTINHLTKNGMFELRFLTNPQTYQDLNKEI